MEEIRVDVDDVEHIGYFKFIHREGYREPILKVYYQGKCVRQYEMKNEKDGSMISKVLLKTFLDGKQS